MAIVFVVVMLASVPVALVAGIWLGTGRQDLRLGVIGAALASAIPFAVAIAEHHVNAAFDLIAIIDTIGVIVGVLSAVGFAVGYACAVPKTAPGGQITAAAGGSIRSGLRDGSTPDADAGAGVAGALSSEDAAGGASAGEARGAPSVEPPSDDARARDADLA